MIKIMIADDHQLIIDGIKSILSDIKDFRVVGEALNGYRVLEQLDAGLRPDIILMDLSLPIIDGWEATRQIKADPATQSIPVIALTAHAMADDEQKALDAGCDDYDTKPVNLKRLLGKIENIMGKC